MIMLRKNCVNGNLVWTLISHAKKLYSLSSIIMVVSKFYQNNWTEGMDRKEPVKQTRILSWPQKILLKVRSNNVWFIPEFNNHFLCLTFTSFQSQFQIQSQQEAFRANGMQQQSSCTQTDRSRSGQQSNSNFNKTFQRFRIKTCLLRRNSICSCY